MMNFDIVTIVNSITPSYESVSSEIIELRRSNPKLTNTELSKKFTKRLRNKYTSIGVGSALPSVIPGAGTAVQIAIEAGTISADLALMLRWMGTMCYGVGILNKKDMSKDFNQDFIRILGIWSGVIMAAKKATTKIGTKVAITQFNRHVSGKILQKINQRVGTTIVTKYGVKRGGIAIGKLIPFGVGALVAGTFNYTTMSGFAKATRTHYESFYDDDFVIIG